ncbi:hypothetical protein IGB42_03421 [Andreprevotia sp. IGB-42]|uniref:hypothetical protein n=1 Tax=Andreprevotia sp. IGB-42 TaxID=2497473 RepID=UPI00135C007B|nr:hypothetical protein [Andreprevotia sp. IGB-42]KAF0812144.1 hypothetical protein IGB42_03421 [Andreprevotia sp. IGB-42]
MATQAKPQEVPANQHTDQHDADSPHGMDANNSETHQRQDACIAAAHEHKPHNVPLQSSGEEDADWDPDSKGFSGREV